MALPVYVANFVLMDYGTGAIFGCPAHDQRDLDFANAYGLGATPVVCPPGVDPATFASPKMAYDGDGMMINSRFLDGLRSRRRRRKSRGGSSDTLGDRPQGKRQVNFRLRDWGISRQRYWGCPIPIIHCPNAASCRCRANTAGRAARRRDLDQPGNPLDRHPTWKHVACPPCGGAARRETDTMDTFVDSPGISCASPIRQAMRRRPTAAAVDMAAGRPVYRRHRARDPASALFPLLHPRDAGRPFGLDEPFAGLFTQGMVVHETYRDQPAGNGSRRPKFASKGAPTGRRAFLLDGDEAVEIGPTSRRCRNRSATPSIRTKSSRPMAPTRRAGSCCRIRRPSAT